MIDRKTLLADLQRLLKAVEADLLERSESAEVPEVGAKLREGYSEALKEKRTARSFEQWRGDAITGAAAAWVLSGVFARFLEDNQLVDPPKIAGPGERLNRARDERELFFRERPTLNDRDYLLSVFDGLTSFAATKDLFGPRNPIRDIPNWPSGDAGGLILGFFQRVDPETGRLVHDFADPDWDTRFLGDLYQDLSESARKHYALLQTPVFVEEFILDRTLDPALDAFGLAKPGFADRLELDGRLNPDDRFRMIDPACGSGHFLLGGFDRLLDRWRRLDPGARDAVLVQRALDSVCGVDLNPQAVAIAGFRLLLAALKECGARRLKDAPGFVIHLACGDSLLHGAANGQQGTLGWTDIDHVYQPEDHDALAKLLRPGSYHAVVANPPYITPKDRALNQAYRDRYETCYMKYSLAVPFLERIVSLAVEGGFTGQITANSFMKREFGKKLIEGFFPKVDLTHVIDTSGAYIPGHGTPTVILFIQNREPVSNALRTVMGIRGEPATPEDSSRGLVWSAIVDQVDKPDSQSEFVSAADTPRELFHKHPWSIGGGGAAELKEELEVNAPTTLAAIVDEIGVFGMTNADDVMLAPQNAFRRKSIEHFAFRRLALGDEIRDWQFADGDCSLFPYREDDLIDIAEINNTHRWLWPSRTVLGNRATFSRLTYFLEGRPWWEWHQVALRRLQSPLSIAYGEVTTHNHFVLDRGGKVFKQTAPVIKLPPGATEKDHLALLGPLNSSTGCFWMKQVCFPKGGDHVGQEGARVRRSLWDERYAFNATNLQALPLPENRPTDKAGKLDGLAQDLDLYAPHGLLARWSDRGIMPGSSIRESFKHCEGLWEATRARMIGLQEELDWECYRLYGLIDADLTFGSEAPGIGVGERAFEIVMGRQMASGALETTWFERHNATAIVEPRPEWSPEYRDLVGRRIEAIASNPNLGLIERPEYKRRWNTEPWADQLSRALRSWLLDRLESYFDFDGRMNDLGTKTAKFPEGLVSVGRLADAARGDELFHEVGALYRDDPAFDVDRLVTELVESASVPLLPVLRYKPTGLRKRAEWERTWELQRIEDAIDARTKLPEGHPDRLSEFDAPDEKKKQKVDKIPVPPKYRNTDFQKPEYWRLRGKLDVPKERWTSLPHCEGEDGTLNIAWAGLNHLQLAQAIGEHYVDVKERLGGREDPRLVPLLAAMLELLPWLKQWHNEVVPEFGRAMSEIYEDLVQEEARDLAISLDEIRAWQPPKKARGRGGRKR